EILADIEKQSADASAAASSSSQLNRPSKQSINSNGANSTTQSLQQQQQKSVRFTSNNSTSSSSGMAVDSSSIPPNKLLQPHHHQPLHISVDMLQLPVDRSFLHSPDPDILAQNTSILRTPSPGPKSPMVLNRSSSTSVAAADSTAVPVFSINDDNEDWNFQSYHLDYKYTPPPIKGPCCVCGDGIMGAMVTALDKMWHPEHFCCVHCGKELRSPGYTENSGKPYCKACHNMLFLPPCSGCNKDIQGVPENFLCCSTYITPLSKVWHPDCFRCTKCTKVLSPDNYFEKDGKPYCEDDFHDLFSPKCHGCKKPIKDDRKVTATGGRNWHPSCFKCCKCHGVLNPNNYKEKDGKLYCEKDFNDLFMPKCAACNTPITQKPTTAMGKTFHPKCFTCTECRKVLSPDNFFEKNGKPYCEDDFHKLFSPKCAGCKKPIKDPKKVVTAQGKQWHPEHFCCTECGIQLDPNNFWEKEGFPYCENDFHKLFSPKCAGCRQPIKTKYIIAMGQHWHPEHFCCHQCGKQLHENEFYEKDGKAYCVDDFLNLFAPKCKKCRTPITDDYCLVALDADWHADCFRCRDCNCLLEDVNFFEINGEPYCEQHFHARQCPDCIRIRRAQNRYFGIPESTPMQPKKWASQVSLKSLDFQTPLMTLNQQSARSSYIIPIEREGASSSASNNIYHIHDHDGVCLHDHDELQATRSSVLSQEQKSRASALGGKNVGWKKSQDNMQFIAKNQSPYVYNEPGKFPVLEPGKHIRFEEVVTKKEYQAISKHY
ncbi:Paxillin, partial [Orchesella cincta]